MYPQCKDGVVSNLLPRPYTLPVISGRVHIFLGPFDCTSLYRVLRQSTPLQKHSMYSVLPVFLFFLAFLSLNNPARKFRPRDNSPPRKLLLYAFPPYELRFPVVFQPSPAPPVVSPIFIPLICHFSLFLFFFFSFTSCSIYYIRHNPSGHMLSNLLLRI